MAGANPYQNQYRQNQVLTATPQQLVLMLYDRALRDLRQAKDAVDVEKGADAPSSNLMQQLEGSMAGDTKYVAESTKLLQHVEEILNELLLSLDADLPSEEGGSIAINLGQLYDYYIIRVREAVITKDTAIIDELSKAIGDLRETWAEAMLKAKQEEKAAKTAAEEENV